MRDGIPADWATTTLGEIRVDFSKSIDPRKDPDRMFELYSIPNFADGRPEVTRGSKIGSTKKTLVPGVVVVSKINPRINRVWVVGHHSDYPKIGSGEWIPFFPIEGIAPDFLAYYLRRDDFRNYLAARVSGVGGSLMRVRADTLAEYPFSFPSLAHQHRIIEAIESYLTRLDAAVASLKRVQKNLERYRASVLKAAVEGRLVPTGAELAKKEGRSYEPASELLNRILDERKKRRIEDATEKARAKAEERARKAGKPWTHADDVKTLEKERTKAAKKYKEPAAPDTTDLPDLPEGWCWTGIQQLCSYESNALKAGPFGSSLKKSFYVSSGFKIYGQEQVLRADPHYGEYYIDEERFRSLESCSVKPRDLLISLVGTIGRTLILPEDIEAGIINPRIIKVTLNEQVVLPEFVQLYLASPRARELFRLGSHGGTMEILNMGILKELPFPTPPVSEQAIIVDAVQIVGAALTRTRSILQKCSAWSGALRQSILNWAFEGKLIEQDPSDEPASVLLERIKADRESMQPRTRRQTGKRKTVNTVRHDEQLDLLKGNNK